MLTMSSIYRCLCGLLILLSLEAVWVTHSAEPNPPLALHPNNPHYFVFRNRPTALITSAEHYGCVLNLDFDFRKYLDTIAADGLNYTRVFTGEYVEPSGAFGIERNTLAPKPDRFLSPWKRAAGSTPTKNIWDLQSFEPDYFERLKSFLSEASQRGIVVEITLFCSTYGDLQWGVHPMNPSNHVAPLPITDWRKLHTLEHPEVLRVQEALTREIVRQTNGFDNVFFEIQNEPWSDRTVKVEIVNEYLAEKVGSFPNSVDIPDAASIAWQKQVAEWIVSEESILPHKHLIAQN
jgi:hypothetical protein